MKFVKESFLLLCGFLVISPLTGCDKDESPKQQVSHVDDGEGNALETQDTNRTIYYGSWMYVESGEKIYITSKSNFDYDVINEKLLMDKEQRYLVRDGVEKLDVYGRLLKPNTGNQGVKRSARSVDYSGIGGISIVLTNIKDKDIKENLVTTEEGKFKKETKIPAGVYKLSVSNAEGTINSEVELEESENDIGNYYLVKNDKSNFKPKAVFDKRFLYANSEYYSGYIRINNISNKDASGLSFIVSTNDSNVDYFDYSNVLGTVPSKSYIDIPITIGCKEIYTNKKTVYVDVLIRDVNYTEWYYKVPINFYRDSIKVNLRSLSANIKGYVSLPNNNNISIDLEEGSIELPSLMDESYYLVLANSKLSNETVYSIGVDVPAENEADLSEFKDTGRYEEENKDIQSAIKIDDGQAIISFLHRGDIDFYKVEFVDNAVLFKNIKNASKDMEYESERFMVTSQVLEYGSTISIDKGDIYVNGNPSGKNAKLKEGDTITIKLMSSSKFDTTVQSKIELGSLHSTFSVTTLEKDVDVDDIDNLNFNTVKDAVISEEYVSNPITIKGINSEVNVSTSNGTLIKNGEEVGADTTVNEGDVISVKIKASEDFLSTESAKVIIGNKSKIFKVITCEKDNTIENFTLENITEAYPGKEYVSNPIFITGINTEVNASIENGKLIKNGHDVGSKTTVKEGDVLKIKLISSKDYMSTVSAVVEIGEKNADYNITTFDKGSTTSEFKFKSKDDAYPGALYFSNPISIVGVGKNVSVDTDKGLIIKNGIEVGTNTTVNDGDIIRIKLKASNNYSEKIPAKISIGSISKKYSLTTVKKLFNNIDYAEKSTVYKSNSIVIPKNDTLITVDNGQIILNGKNYQQKSMVGNQGDVIALQLTSSDKLGGMINSNITIGDITDSFVIKTKEKDYKFIKNGRLIIPNSLEDFTYYYLKMSRSGNIDIVPMTYLSVAIFDRDMNKIQDYSDNIRSIFLPAGVYILGIETSSYGNLYVDFFSPIINEGRDPEVIENNGSYESNGTTYYELNMPQNGNLDIDVDDNSIWGCGNKLVTIYDKELNVLNKSSSKNRVVSLTKGEYLIRLLEYKDCIFSLYTPVLDTDHNLETITNGIYSPEKTKYYYFDMPEAGNVDIDSDDETSVTIYDKNMNIVAQQSYFDRVVSLSEGTYIIKIIGNGKPVSFYTPVHDSVHNFSLLGNGSYIIDQMKYYYLVMPEDGNIDMYVYSSDKQDVIIYDQKMNIVSRSSSRYNDNLVSLVKGTYIVKIDGNGDGVYFYSPVIDKDKDSRIIANGTYSPTEIVSNYIRMPSDGNLDIDISHSTRVAVYDENMNVISKESSSDRTLSLAKGDYVVMIIGDGNPVNFYSPVLDSSHDFKPLTNGLYYPSSAHMEYYSLTMSSAGNLDIYTYGALTTIFDSNMNIISKRSDDDRLLSLEKGVYIVKIKYIGKKVSFYSPVLDTDHTLTYLKNDFRDTPAEVTYYYLKLDNPSSFSYDSNADTTTYVRVYDENLSFIARPNEQEKLSLDAGNYIVKVSGLGDKVFNFHITN